MDAVTAFLDSILKEIIYVKQAEGFVAAEHPNWVYLLNKVLYGLKQSGTTSSKQFWIQSNCSSNTLNQIMQYS